MFSHQKLNLASLFAVRGGTERGDPGEGLYRPRQEVHAPVVLQLQGPAPHIGLGSVYVPHPGGQAPALRMSQPGTRVFNRPFLLDQLLLSDVNCSVSNGPMVIFAVIFVVIVHRSETLVYRTPKLLERMKL